MKVCTHCNKNFNPSGEGIVGKVLSFCGQCCNDYDWDENNVEEYNKVLRDMEDMVANGCPFMEL